MLALLAELEALARAVLCTVGVNLDGVITNSDRPGTGPARELPIITRHATTGFVLRFAAASGAVAPVISFVVVVPTTAFVPFNEVHKISPRA